MNIFRKFVIVVSLVSLGTCVFAESDHLIYHLSYRSSPIWVPAALAFRGDDFARELFDPDDYPDLDRYLHDARAVGSSTKDRLDGCDVRIWPAVITPGPESSENSTLESLVANFPNAYVGVVETVSPGFYESYLGSLVVVQLKHQLGGQPPSQHFARLFIEYGFVDIGGTTFCNRGWRDTAPERGDRVLFFSPVPLSDSEYPVLAIGDEFLFYGSEKKLSLPSAMASKLPNDYRLEMSELLEKAARFLDTGGE